MRITHSTKVNSATSNEDFIIDYKIPDDPEYWRKEERKRLQRELDDEADYYDLIHEEGIYSSDSIKAAADIKPAGGDMINYIMVYTGPGYSQNTPQAVLEWGKKQGFDKMFWGSDEAYKMNGIYNGDTYILYKDANKLPAGYKEDALDAEKYNRVISCQMIEGATAEELQKKFAEYQKMNDQLGKQLDDLQQDQLQKFNKATQKKEKKGFFKRAFGSEENPIVQKVSEDANSIEYVVSAETIGQKWMGEYLTDDGQIKKVYFTCDTEDWDKASDTFEDSIPESYQSCRLYGPADDSIIQQSDFTYIEGVTSSSDANARIIEELKEELGNEIHRFMVDVCGFDEEDDPNDICSLGADNFWRVNISEMQSEDGEQGICIEVGAELGYDSTEELLDRLNNIVKKYDSEAYFEPYDPGISVCYLWESTGTTASTQINASNRHPESREEWLEPLELPEVNMLDTYQEEVVIDFDVDIDIAEDGSYKYLGEDGETESLEFAKDSDTSDGDYYLTYDGLQETVRLRDYISVVEDLDELLVYELPDEFGVHHISGQATLVYDVSGLAEESGEVSVRNLVVEFNRDASKINNFKFD